MWPFPQVNCQVQLVCRRITWEFHKRELSLRHVLPHLPCLGWFPPTPMMVGILEHSHYPGCPMHTSMSQSVIAHILWIWPIPIGLLHCFRSVSSLWFWLNPAWLVLFGDFKTEFWHIWIICFGVRDSCGFCNEYSNILSKKYFRQQAFILNISPNFIFF